MIIFAFSHAAFLPVGGNITFFFKLVQHGVQRPLVEHENAVGAPLQLFNDLIAVAVVLGQKLQHHNGNGAF